MTLLLVVSRRTSPETIQKHCVGANRINQWDALAPNMFLSDDLLSSAHLKCDPDFSRAILGFTPTHSNFCLLSEFS